MVDQGEFEQLRREVRYLTDRAEILDCVAQHARGCDRHDAALLGPDSTTATVLCGRYVDRLERRDGRWGIAVRRATVELAFTADSRLLQSPFFTSQGYETGTRDRTDLSYDRPLSATAET